MSHFQLEKEIERATGSMGEVPLQRGREFRWRRKAIEGGFKGLSLDDTKANNCSSLSTMSTRRTPSLSPGRLSSNIDRLSTSKGRTPGKNNKTPSKSAPNTPTRSGDRYIPNRSMMDINTAQYLLSNSNNENVNPDNPVSSPGTAEQQRRMATALGSDNNKQYRILSFKQTLPESHAQSLGVLYTGVQSASVRKVQSSRHIPQQADRILDAPELLDDFYLNLLSWSCSSQMAIALGQAVYVWDSESGSILELTSLEDPDEYISSVAWITEGPVLAIGLSRGHVQLWDVKQQNLVRSMTGHPARVGSLAWNNYILSSGSRTGTIHHHDVRVPNHHVGTLSGHCQEVCGLAWSPDGRHLASGANDNLALVWDSTLSIGGTSSPLHTLNQHQAAVKALSWCPWQSSLLATGGGTADRHIRAWNVTTGACVHSLDTGSQVSAILWSKEHRELCSGHGFVHNQVMLWKYPKFNKVAELRGHQSRILGLALSPDGTTVASAAADETLRLWKCWDYDKKKTTKSTKDAIGSSLLAKTIR